MENRRYISGYRFRARQQRRDILVASALTFAALALLGLTFMGDRSPKPQPVASTESIVQK
jgi:hypothetical protein